MNEETLRQTTSLAQSRKVFRKYLFVFFFIFLLVGSFWLGYSRGKKSDTAIQSFPLDQTQIINKNSPQKSVDFSLFWKVWGLVKEKYVNKDSLDAQKMVYGAIRGMLGAIGDPYSTFFDPAETKSFSQDLEGSFEGIGAELGIKDNILTVIAPLSGSPAEKAGLRAGDKILKVGDRTTADVTIEEAVDLIRGKKGTEVKLTILRLGEDSVREIFIIRDTISVKSVELEIRPDSIAHLKITKFGDDTAKEFDAAANQIISQGAKGIILDLRNNPGGFLDKAVSVASRMIPKNKLVVTEEDNAGKKDNLYTSGGDRLGFLPVVVLINEGSASAAEILAGALRDDRNIQLIGKKSFGKGSVQELIDLPGNSSVKITVNKWMTPNGDSIMDRGIMPNIEVDLTQDDFDNNRDPQLDKALEFIQQEILSKNQG